MNQESRNPLVPEKNSFSCFPVFLIQIVIPVISAVMVSAGPTPAPFTISDDEIKKLSKEEIAQTVKHQGGIISEVKEENQELRNRLSETVASQNIALVAAGGALNEITKLNGEIRALADHDASVTEKLNKANKALWWYRLHWWGAWVMLGLGVAACFFFYGAKIMAKIGLKAAVI